MNAYGALHNSQTDARDRQNSIGFVENRVVPTTLDGRQSSPTPVALAIDIALLALFAVATTAYILLAVHFLEERDLVATFGDPYAAYRQRVPMLLPLSRPRKP